MSKGLRSDRGGAGEVGRFAARSAPSVAAAKVERCASCYSNTLELYTLVDDDLFTQVLDPCSSLALHSCVYVRIGIRE